MSKVLYGFVSLAFCTNIWAQAPESLRIHQEGHYYFQILAISVGGASTISLQKPIQKAILNPLAAQALQNPGPSMEYWNDDVIADFKYLFKGWTFEKKLEKYSPQYLGIFNRGEPLEISIQTEIEGKSVERAFPVDPNLCHEEEYENSSELGFYFVCDDAIYFDDDMDFRFKIFTIKQIT